MNTASEPHDSADAWALPTPAFKAEDALVAMKRALRDMKLSERGTRYEMSGKTIAELGVEGPALRLKLVRRPARTPDWDFNKTISNTSQQRDALVEVKKRLARWEGEEG